MPILKFIKNLGLVEKKRGLWFYIWRFNITILAGLFSWVFGRLLGRWRGALLSFLAIALYTIMVGAAAAAVRAALMGGLALFARQIGRRQDGLNSLAFVSTLICLVG